MYLCMHADINVYVCIHIVHKIILCITAWIFLMFGIILVVYLSENRNFIWFKTNFQQIFKMASSGLKENAVPNKIIVTNIDSHNIFPMMVRGMLSWGLRCARILWFVGTFYCQCWIVIDWKECSPDVIDYHSCDWSYVTESQDVMWLFIRLGSWCYRTNV